MSDLRTHLAELIGADALQRLLDEIGGTQSYPIASAEKVSADAPADAPARPYYARVGDASGLILAAAIVAGKDCGLQRGEVEDALLLALARYIGPRAFLSEMGKR